MRPHLAHARRQGARRWRATGAGQRARQRVARGLLRRLSRRGGRHRHVEKGRGAGADRRRSRGDRAAEALQHRPAMGLRAARDGRAAARSDPAGFRARRSRSFSCSPSASASPSISRTWRPRHSIRTTRPRAATCFRASTDRAISPSSLRSRRRRRWSGDSRAETPRSWSKCRPVSVATFSTPARRRSTRRSMAP